MKKIILLLSFLTFYIPKISSQNTEAYGLTRATVEMRSSYHYNSIDGIIDNNASGFKGNYFQFLLSGDISDKFHFDFRQKFNKYSADYSFFDATDKALLIYTPTDQLNVKLGKRPLTMGGCDYGIIPIDLYLTGQYCDLLTIYQWGVSSAFTNKSGSDTFTFELTQSPFKNYSSNKNIYAYSGIWEGSHGIVDFLHSIHLYGTEEGKYVNWIMLGHRFNLGKIKVEADVLNKYSIAGKDAKSNNSFLFKDYSLVGKLIYNPTEQLSLAVKWCYDVNKCEYDDNDQMTLENCDYHVTPGTEINRLGGIVEYYPLKGDKRNIIRFHLAGYYDWGINTNQDATLIDKQLFVTLGMTIKYSLLK